MTEERKDLICDEADKLYEDLFRRVSATAEKFVDREECAVAVVGPLCQVSHDVFSTLSVEDGVFNEEVYSIVRDGFFTALDKYKVKTIDRLKKERYVQ